MDGWVARPRPERNPQNAATRLDPSSLAAGLAGITFAGPELSTVELLEGRPAERGEAGPPVWTVEVAYASDHRFDQVVTADLVAMQARGFRVILRVDYARKQPIPPAGDMVALSEYVRAFVRLHEMTDGKIRHFVIGNEGNVDTPGDDPSRVTECLGGRASCAPEWYVQVYRAVRAGLRSATDAYLIVGAPSPGDESDPMRWMDGAEYLGRVLALLHPLEVDGVALHAYGGPATDPGHGIGKFAGQMASQLAAIEGAGLISTPVFVTEINQDGPGSPEFAAAAFEWIDAHNRRSRVDVIAACWFVYHDATGEWSRYALEDEPAMLAAIGAGSRLPPGR
jgi:hypothetical protein